MEDFLFIAEYKSEVIDSTYTIYGIFKKKQDLDVPALSLKRGILKTSYISIVIPVMSFTKSNLIFSHVGLSPMKASL